MMTFDDYEEMECAFTDGSPVQMTVQGSPVEDIRCPNQRIRMASNGYIVTRLAFRGHWIYEEVPFEIADYSGDSALERALSTLVDEIGTQEDTDRVNKKLFTDHVFLVSETRKFLYEHADAFLMDDEEFGAAVLEWIE
jgi:hypothetical protein